jgi:hypothetical protein
MKAEVNGQQFLLDPRGAYVPLSVIRPIDVIRDELVEEVLAEAVEMHREILIRREKLWEKIVSFLELSAGEYGVQFGGVKGNCSLSSFDGKKQIKIHIGEHKAVNETIHTAKAMIDECLERWIADAEKSKTDESREGINALRALVNKLFAVNQEGRIDFNLLYSLKKYEISDPRWKRAMEAIDQAIEVIGSSKYLRFYTRASADVAWEIIPMEYTKMTGK